jgi:hypothetical protein
MPGRIVPFIAGVEITLSYKNIKNENNSAVACSCLFYTVQMFRHIIISLALAFLSIRVHNSLKKNSKIVAKFCK